MARTMERYGVRMEWSDLLALARVLRSICSNRNLWDDEEGLG